MLKCPLANSGQYFVCPITGIPLNGTNPIAQARPCGCVAAIRAWANAGVIRREPGDSGLPEPLPESACLVVSCHLPRCPGHPLLLCPSSPLLTWSWQLLLTGPDLTLLP